MLTVLTQRGMKYSLRFLNDKFIQNVNKGPRFQYFAFGANMDPDLLRKKKIFPKSSRKCELRGYELRIDVPCEFKNKGFASVSKAPGKSVWGVVHDISLAEMIYIDVLEWVPFSFHERVKDKVFVNSRKTPVEAWFYIAGAPKKGLKTSKAYQKMLIDAASKFDFPKKYISMIERLPTAVKFECDPGFRLSNPRKRRLLENELSNLYLAHDKLRDKLCSII